MAEKPGHVSPPSSYTVGYWARVHDLTFRDLKEMSMTNDLDGVVVDREEFERGWKDCDTEIKSERLTALRDALADPELADDRIQGKA